MKNLRLAFLISMQINCLGLFAQYCVPVVTGPQPLPPDTTGIINVSVNAINNNSASKAGFQNFTAQKAIMYKGVPDTIYYTTGESFESSIGWIDYNLNFAFDYLTEQVINSFSMGLSTTAFVPMPVPVTVPITASSGISRLRLASYDGFFGFIVGTYTCVPISKGDIEEYTIEIRDTIAVMESGDKFFHGCVVRGDQNKVILGVEITPTDPLGNETLQSIQFNTQGSKNPVIDITNAKLWYTGTTEGFVPSATLIGSTPNPNGAFAIACNQPMVPGSTNYFWLTYDISNNAVLNDSIAAELVQVTVSGSNYLPVVNDQPSYRKISQRRNIKRKEGNVWYPGSGYGFPSNQGFGIDFNCDPPCIISDPNPGYGYYGAPEGVGSICDANGELLFYAGAGGILYNRAHQMITSSIYSTSAQTSNIFIRRPGSLTKYYLFTTSQNNFGNGLYYTELDLALKNGLGDTVAGAVNKLAGGTPSIWSEAVAATDHCNGKDVWVIVGDTTTSKTAFHAYLITSAGIQPPVISNVPGGPTYSSASISRHHIEVSPDGSKLAVGKVIGGSGYLLDFDNSSGVISNPLALNPADGQTMSFSADNSKLYFNQYGKAIYQYDLCAANILASRTFVGNSVAVGWQMQLAPDNRIYIPRQDTTFYTTINKPQMNVPLCDFQQNGFFLEGFKDGYAGSFSVGYNESIFNSSILNGGFIKDNDTCMGVVITFTDTTAVMPGCSPKPRTWTWNFGDPTSGASNTSAMQNPSHTYTAAGTYTVTLIINEGCQYDTAAMVVKVVDCGFIVTASTTNVKCKGECSGVATVNPIGGTSPFTYSWNTLPLQTTQVATSLCAGAYSVIVTDALNIKDTAFVTITEPLTFTLAAPVVTNVNCNSLCTGSASVTVSGATPGYTYLWNSLPAQANAAATGLCAGTYSCIITDANGCDTIQSVTITEPPVLTAPLTFTSTTCGLNNGIANINPSGGTPGYNYSWSTTPPQIGATATALAGGITYTVIITDSGGCTQSQTVTIAPSAGPGVSITANNVLCHGGNTATASSTVSAGTFPYTYSWSLSPVQNTSMATGLSNGTYTCTVIDAMGCITTQTVIITQPQALVVAASVTSTACNDSTGIATVTVSGGTVSYSYLWSNGQTNMSALGLPKATYSITITDANYCSITSVVAVESEACPCRDIALPNAFSPNNDGENDEFCLQGGEDHCISNLHITIYDRWGERVYDSEDKNFCWDGSYNDKPQSTAVFVYYLDAILTDGKQISRKGNISLVR